MKETNVETSNNIITVPKSETQPKGGLKERISTWAEHGVRWLHKLKGKAQDDPKRVIEEIADAPSIAGDLQFTTADEPSSPGTDLHTMESKDGVDVTEDQVQEDSPPNHVEKESKSDKTVSKAIKVTYADFLQAKLEGEGRHARKWDTKLLLEELKSNNFNNISEDQLMDILDASNRGNCELMSGYGLRYLHTYHKDEFDAFILAKRVGDAELDQLIHTGQSRGFRTDWSMHTYGIVKSKDSHWYAFSPANTEIAKEADGSRNITEIMEPIKAASLEELLHKITEHEGVTFSLRHLKLAAGNITQDDLHGALMHQEHTKNEFTQVTDDNIATVDIDSLGRDAFYDTDAMLARHKIDPLKTAAEKIKNVLANG